MVCRPSRVGNVLTVCLPAGTTGQPCANTADCALGFGCDPDTQLCVDLHGGNCGSDADCHGLVCDPCQQICASPGYDALAATADFDDDETGTDTDGSNGDSEQVAEWADGIGLPDGDGSSFGLHLLKTGSQTDPGVAAAVFTGFECGSPVCNLGFDFLNGGHCTAGSPRYNVVTGGFCYFYNIGGCASGVQTPAPDAPTTWTRVRFDQSDVQPGIVIGDPLDCGAVAPAFQFGVTPVDLIQILVDESDVVTGNPATAGIVIDNLLVNDTLIREPGGTPVAATTCGSAT